MPQTSASILASKPDTVLGILQSRTQPYNANQMTPTINALDEDGLTLVTVVGPLTLANMVKYAEALLSEVRNRKPLIWDLRQASFKLNADQVKELAAAVNRVAEQNKPKTAFVVDQDLEFGLVRMFGAYRDHGETKIGVFRELDAARQWIAETQT
jgi:hypothetical protein